MKIKILIMIMANGSLPAFLNMLIVCSHRVSNNLEYEHEKNNAQHRFLAQVRMSICLHALAYDDESVTVPTPLYTHSHFKLN